MSKGLVFSYFLTYDDSLKIVLVLTEVETVLDDLALTLLHYVAAEDSLLILLVHASFSYGRKVWSAAAALEHDLSVWHELLEVIHLELMERKTAEVKDLEVSIFLKTCEHSDIVSLF